MLRKIGKNRNLTPWDPVVNRFEHVCSDGRHMWGSGGDSWGGSLYQEVPCLEAAGGFLCSEVPCLERGRLVSVGLYSEVQCIMGNGHMGTLCGQNDGQT